MTRSKRRTGTKPHKVVALGLEKRTLQLRGEAKTTPQICAALNTELAVKGVEDKLTARSIERYFATLDEATVPVAHQPQAAEENLRLGMNVAGDVADLTDKLRQWLEQAEAATVIVYDSEGQPYSEQPDWRARTSVAKEFRETLKFTADVLERIYNQERIRVFQQTVVEVVNEEEPDVARRIKTRFQSNAEIMRARLLGL